MKKLIINCLLISLHGLVLLAQDPGVVVSGTVRDARDRQPLPYVTLQVLQTSDSSFVAGTVASERGSFTIEGLWAGDYLLKASFMGFSNHFTPFHVGRLNPFLDLGNILLSESTVALEGVSVEAMRQEVLSAMDRKVYQADANVAQSGGSVLQLMQNLPGVTIDRDGKVSLRGSEQVTVLIDGKQTALTGMGSQEGLDNIPASAIEAIEIINNPSARYDASGMAGVINIIFRKEQQSGWNARGGISGGLGNFSRPEPNLVTMRDQYRFTPKINPSLSVNHRKNTLNIFAHGDLLYHRQMMKNEYFIREYSQGEPVRQQWLENRTQPIYNLRGGVDYLPNERHSITFSTLYNYRAYTDLGDLPYISMLTGQTLRMWEYYEKEVNQTLFATVTHKYSFPQPGHTLTSSFNYSFRRKDEVFHFTNRQNGILGTDTTALVADENIFDLTADYVRPLPFGRAEVGTRQRARIFPNHISFMPGINSILDNTLAGDAEYREYLSALYANAVFEFSFLEVEAGLRGEYARIDYLVDPTHSVYQSDGFDYLGLFPNVRATWIMNEKNRLSVFYNRRVDRPEERNLRGFPTYADPEILSMGNPRLIPQFSHSMETGYRRSWDSGYLYGAAYHRISRNLLTRIITQVPGSALLASIDQNAGKGYNSGMELAWSQRISQAIRVSANANYYYNRIAAFSVVNAYPGGVNYSRGEQSAWAGNVKAVGDVNLPAGIALQLSTSYFSPDILPQGRILERYSVDAAITKEIQNGRGELFMTLTDIFNSMKTRYQIEGNDFVLHSRDYYETQVVRVGYNFRIN